MYLKESLVLEESMVLVRALLLWVLKESSEQNEADRV